MRYSKLVILFLLLDIIVATIISYSIAVVIITAIWIFLAYILLKISLPKRSQATSLYLFFLFFSIYFLYVLVTNLVYVDNPYYDFFYEYDAIDFYTRIDLILGKSQSFDMLDEVLFQARHWKGFGVVSWITGLIAYAVGDQNNIVIQQLQIVFVCALTLVFLYNIGRLLLSPRQSWKMTILFGLCSHIFISSAALGRDTYILLFYTMGFYILLGKWSIRNLVLLLLLGFITMQFRLQHGIFFMVLIASYGWLGVRQKRSPFVAALLGIVLLTGFGGAIIVSGVSFADDVTGKVENYQSYHGEKFEKSSGLTAIASRFPKPLVFIPNFIISQTYPYPAYKAVYVNVTDTNQYLKFPLIVSQVYWMGTWIVLLIILIGYRKPQMIPVKLKYSLLISILLIISVSFGSYEFRRMICVYPILFVSTYYLIAGLSARTRTLILYRAGAVYLGLFVVYVTLRGF